MPHTVAGFLSYIVLLEDTNILNEHATYNARTEAVVRLY